MKDVIFPLFLFFLGYFSFKENNKENNVVLAPTTRGTMVTTTKDKENNVVIPPITRATRVTTTKDSVTIWSYPGKTQIATLDKGTNLIVIDSSKKWYIKVLLPDGREGWVFSLFVK